MTTALAPDEMLVAVRFPKASVPASAMRTFCSAGGKVISRIVAVAATLSPKQLTARHRRARQDKPVVLSDVGPLTSWIPSPWRGRARDAVRPDRGSARAGGLPPGARRSACPQERCRDA